MGRYHAVQADARRSPCSMTPAGRSGRGFQSGQTPTFFFPLHSRPWHMLSQPCRHMATQNPGPTPAQSRLVVVRALGTPTTCGPTKPCQADIKATSGPTTPHLSDI